MGSRRCDFDPRKPRLTLIHPVAGNLPHLNKDAIKRARRIFTHPQAFPELTGKNLAPRERIRRRRPERLEACALIAMSLARRADRRTFRVGTQRDDGLCTGRTVAEHAADTGLSLTRTRRALAEFEGWGMNSLQPVEELRDKDGNPTPKVRAAGDPRRRGKKGSHLQTHRGLPAVRTLTPTFWVRLGITPKKIAKARKSGADDWKRRHAKPASVHAIRAVFREMRETLRAESDRSKLEALERGQRARLERIRLRAEHPDWGPDDIRRAVDALIRS